MKKSLDSGEINALILDQQEGACPSTMHSKRVKAGSRGRKVTDKRKKLEARLITWCAKQWDNHKKVSRGIILRRTLLYDPTFCGGKQNPKLMAALKQWFYGGFKKRCKLSRRVVSSTGQKLPKDWEEKVRSIVARVANSQMPCQKPDGSFLAGVTDSKMGNTDQVPFYIENHSNHQWGYKSDLGRRLISTAGKEKSRFTVQLTVFKNGCKVITSVKDI